MTRPGADTARAMLAAMAAGRTSSVALVEASLAHAADINPALNALVHVDAEGALERARHADRRRASGDPGALLGLPVTIKDTIAVAGMPCTAGVAALRGHYPAANAPSVQRLVDAGAVVIGKSNVPPYAGDLQTDNALHGPTLNPWDRSCNAGGSSGGAAAAVAAGIVALELGSDLAGSLRIPAHCCGVSAIRPTTGLVDAHGQLMGPAIRRRPLHMLTVGPIARDCGDLALALPVLAGGTAAAAGPDDPLLDTRLDGLSALAWLDDPVARVDPDVGEVLARALAKLRAAGLAVHEASPVADAAGMFERFLRLMYAALAAEFPEGAWARCVEAAAATTEARALPALMPPAVTVRHRDWLRLREAQAVHAAAINALLDRHGLLLCPVLHRSAWPTDTRPLHARRCLLGGEPGPWMQQAFWTALPAFAGLPAVVMPAGLDTAGRPVGLQLIGPSGSDFALLRTAARFQAALWPDGPPAPS